MLISTNWTFFPQLKIILIPDQEFLPSVVYKAIVRIAKMRFTLVNV
jgi:hypothetical protein